MPQYHYGREPTAAHGWFFLIFLYGIISIFLFLIYLEVERRSRPVYEPPAEVSVQDVS